MTKMNKNKTISSFELVQYGQAQVILEQHRPEFTASAMGAAFTEKEALDDALAQLEKAGWNTDKLIENSGFRVLASQLDTETRAKDGYYWYVTVFVNA